MAVQGPFRVTCGELFPHGVGIVGAVAPYADFNASTKENRVQAREKESGLPVWAVDVMDFDPDARERTHRVKVAAAVQPVPPEAVDGVPVRPVLLEGLTVTPYLKEGPKGRDGQPRWSIAYSLRATGLAAPRRGAVDTSKAA